jgi:hypothetical protein
MIPLSFAQRRLWFVDRFEGPSPTYNGAFAIRLTGELNVGALESALRDVIDRHEVLRTVIVEGDDGVPYQQVRPSGAEPFALPVVEVAAADRPAAVDETAKQTFDLAADIPIRARLIRTGPREHTLVLVVHHIALDGESLGPLLRDLTTAYSARRGRQAPGWEPLPIQYADYTLWQQEMLGDESDPESVAARQLAYWREALAALVQPLSLPTDRPRPRVMSSRGDLVQFPIEPELLKAVQKLVAEQDITVSMVMHAALAVLLYHFGCGADVPIGAPIAGRVDEELRDLVGFFVNTWVLRVDLSGHPTFRQLLDRVRDRSLGAYDNQDLPFERLVELLNPDRSTAYHPFFQVMLAWQEPLGDLAFAGLEVESETLETATAKFDLFFNIIPNGAGGAGVRLEYATDLFDRATAESLATRFTRVLSRLVADPDRAVTGVDVLETAERDQLLARADAVTTAGEQTIPELFESQAARTPGAVAVECAGRALTYRELADRSGHLARELVRRGAGPEDLVVLAVPRSEDLVVGLRAGRGSAGRGASALRRHRHRDRGRAARRRPVGHQPRPPRSVGRAGGSGADLAAGPGQPRVRDVHLGVERPAQGRRDHPPQRGQRGAGAGPPPRRAGRLADAGRHLGQFRRLRLRAADHPVHRWHGRGGARRAGARRAGRLGRARDQRGAVGARRIDRPPGPGAERPYGGLRR